MFSNRKTKWVLSSTIGALLVLSAFFSPVWYDDAGHFLVAREGTEHLNLCYPVHLNAGICDDDSQFITMGPALSAPAAFWMGIFGTPMISIRLMMVFFSLAFLGVLIWVSIQMFDRMQTEKGWATVLLIGGNIQFLTYGAEFLGEVPMLLWLFAGFGFFLKMMNVESEKLKFALLAGLCWAAAALTKEYILMPLCGSLIIWSLINLISKKWKAAFACFFILAFLTLTIFAYHLTRTGSLDGLLNFLHKRNSYGNEFFAFEFGEAIHFLIFKPLIWLGTFAMLVKLYFRRDKKELFLAIFHFIHLAFFLASAGYDRFGFQLLFIPALYLSEFVVLIVLKIQNKSLLLKSGLVLLFLLVATQNTFPILARRVLGYDNNVNEQRVNEMLLEKNVFEIFTYDQQIVPFLEDNIRFRLNDRVPSAAGDCERMHLRPGEIFVAGPYAFTEFPHCIDWSKLKLIIATADSVYKVYEALED